MEEDFNQNNEENDYTESLGRFEQMLKNDDQYFFDVEVFETLIDHYLEKNDVEKNSSKWELLSCSFPCLKSQFLLYRWFFNWNCYFIHLL